MLLFDDPLKSTATSLAVNANEVDRLMVICGANILASFSSHFNSIVDWVPEDENFKVISLTHEAEWRIYALVN